MNPLILELRDLVGLYLDLQKDLGQIMNESDPASIQSLSEAILDNRNLLTQIQQMNVRALQTSRNWQISRSTLDPETRDAAQELMATATVRANQIKQMCIMHTQKLQAARDKLEKELMSLNKGCEFLKSMKPIKNNYPKFIDSVF